MFKRVLLALTFVAALGAGGLGISNTADAHGGWYRGGHGYYGHRSYYPGHFYGPRFSYYRGHHHGFYHYPRHYHRSFYHGHHGHHGYYGRPRSGFYFSIGF